MTYHASKVKPGKCLAFSTNIHGNRLMEALSFRETGKPSHKLPADMQGVFRMILPADSGIEKVEGRYRTTDEFVGLQEVTVQQAQSQGIPRVFVACACGKKVPFGRVAQHSHDEKFGTVCRTTEARYTK